MTRLAKPKKKVTTYRLYPRAESLRFKCHVSTLSGPGLSGVRVDGVSNQLHVYALNRHTKVLNALSSNGIDTCTIYVGVTFEQYSTKQEPCGVGRPRVSKARRDVDVTAIADPDLQYVTDEYEFRCRHWSLVQDGINVGLEALVKRLGSNQSEADRFLEAARAVGRRYVENAYSPIRVRRPEDPCHRERRMLYYTTEFESSELADTFVLDLKERGFEVHARVMASGRHEVLFWRDLLRAPLDEEERGDLKQYVESFGGVVVRTHFC